MMIKGEEHKTKTLHDLVLLIVRLRYEHGLNDRIREQIIKAGQRHGLLSETEQDLPYHGRQRGPRRRNTLP